MARGRAAGRPSDAPGSTPGRRELAAVGALFAAVLVATLVTHARVSPGDLYNVSESGLAGGLSRVLLELNFPDALLAIPLALIAADVLRTTWARLLAGVAVAASLVTALPGVVDQGDLDARPVNVVPAVGVGLTVVLVVLALPRFAAATPRLGGDVARLVLAVLLAVAAVPYVFAELGLYAPDPLLADEPSPGEDIAAVHLGSHEGMDGALLAFAALALTRLTPWLTSKVVAAISSAMLAVLLSYGVANLVADDWLEQVVKRGWTDAKIPSVVRPQLSLWWALIVLCGIAVETLWFRRERAAAAATRRNPVTG